MGNPHVSGSGDRPIQMKKKPIPVLSRVSDSPGYHSYHEHGQVFQATISGEDGEVTYGVRWADGEVSHMLTAEMISELDRSNGVDLLGRTVMVPTERISKWLGNTLGERVFAQIVAVKPPDSVFIQHAQFSEHLHLTLFLYEHGGARIGGFTTSDVLIPPPLRISEELLQPVFF